MAKASKVAAKVKGGMKAAGSALTGYPGIFRHLAAEHGEVSVLMKRVAGSSDGSDVREELFPEIRKNLLAHAKAEEQEFYEPLRNRSATRDLIRKSLDQHRKIEEYVEKLSSGNKATQTWLETFERMMRAVEQHVDLEENQLFPAAKELLSTNEAQEMEEQYEEAEEQEKAHL